MTGKITFINREPDYDKNQCYNVTLANGQSFKFYQLKEYKGKVRTEFSKKVGDEIEFEISSPKYNTKPVSQQSSIEFQSCLRSAAILYSNNPTVKSSTVLETTELFYNKLKHITNV
jgi:hypothetical protein